MKDQQATPVGAGRELDNAVAEIVFGFTWWRHAPEQVAMPDYTGDNPRFLLPPKYVADNSGIHQAWWDRTFVAAGPDVRVDDRENSNVPAYSTSWEGAGLVIAKMQEHGWDLHLTLYNDGSGNAAFKHERDNSDLNEVSQNGEHVATMVARAALLARSIMESAVDEA